MKSYSKYVYSLIIAIVAYVLSNIIIIQFSKSPNGQNTDFGFIELGITLIIALIIGCTSLILFAINEINKNNK